MGACQSLPVNAIANLLRKTFLKGLIRDADMPELASNFEFYRNLVLGAFSFRGKVFGLLASGCLKFMNMKTVQNQSYKSRIQFVGSKDSNGKALSIFTLSTLSWNSFMKTKQYLVERGDIFSENLLEKLPQFSNVDSSSLFIFGLLVDLAMFNQNNMLIQNDVAVDSKLKESSGILLCGKLAMLDNSDEDSSVNLGAIIAPKRFDGVIHSASSKKILDYIADEKQFSISKGGLFALSQTMLDARMCTFNCKCFEDNTLVGLLSKASVKLIQSELPLLYKVFQRELHMELLSTTLSNVMSLQLLSPEALATIATTAEITFPALDTNLCLEGDKTDPTNDYVYIVLAGQLEVSGKNVATEGVATKKYSAYPQGCYAIVGDLAVTAQLPTCIYTVCCKAARTMLFQIPGAVYRSTSGAFNTTVSDMSDKALCDQRDKCAIHDILFSSAGYDHFQKFVKQELALENVLYWRAVSVYYHILNQMELIFVEEYHHMERYGGIDKDRKRHQHSFDEISRFSSGGDHRLTMVSKLQSNRFMELSKIERPISQDESMLASYMSYRATLTNRVSARAIDKVSERIRGSKSALAGTVGDSSILAVWRMPPQGIPEESPHQSIVKEDISVNMDIHILLLQMLLLKLVDNFLVVDSENEVNIPGKLRDEMLIFFESFKPSSDKFDKMMKVKYDPSIQDDEDEDPFDDWATHVNVLDCSLMEVLKMLDRGPFIRWKHSPAFPAFLESHVGTSPVT